MNSKLAIFLFICGLTFTGLKGHAQDFIYQPQNPAFGGSYLNYQWMLSSANAQNKIEEGQDDLGLSSYGVYDPMEDFQEDLQRRFFDELSRQIINSYFGEGSYGEGDIEDGTYSFGTYDINIFSDSEGLNIVIRDYSQGGETTITIPNL